MRNALLATGTAPIICMECTTSHRVNLRKLAHVRRVQFTTLPLLQRVVHDYCCIRGSSTALLVRLDHAC